MGAWGYGPFDSDQALDYLGDLAHQHAKTDDNYDIVPGTVNRDAVLTDLREALTTRVTSLTEEIVDTSTLAYVYAAAGLIAAVTAGRTATSPSGTRLFAAIGGSNQTVTDPLGLDHHCGYVALLTIEDATELIPLARECATALAAATAWHSEWSDPEQLKNAVQALADALPR